MPPQSKISQLPEDLRLWLEDELAASGCTNYGSITTALNQKLTELSYGGEISREAVRRFGVKLSARLDFRDRLIEHIRDELDPERTLPPADWNRAVISAMGYLNYRTLTDLQCQETITVKEHAAFVRTLLQTHKYEKLLCVEPLRYEEVGAIPSPAATRLPSPPRGEGGLEQRERSGEGRDEGLENPPQNPLESVPTRFDTEKHGTTQYVPPQTGRSGPLTRQQRRRMERLAAREAEKEARKRAAAGLHRAAA